MRIYRSAADAVCMADRSDAILEGLSSQHEEGAQVRRPDMSCAGLDASGAGSCPHKGMRVGTDLLCRTCQCERMCQGLDGPDASGACSCPHKGLRDGTHLLCRTCDMMRQKTKVACPGIDGRCAYDAYILPDNKRQLCKNCVRKSRGVA